MSDFHETEESPIVSIQAAFAMILDAHPTYPEPSGLAEPLPLWMDVKPYFSKFGLRILDTRPTLEGSFPLRGKGVLLQIEASPPPLPPSPPSKWEGGSFIPVFRRKILPKNRNSHPFGNLVARIPREINPIPKEHRRVSSARRLISKN